MKYPVWLCALGLCLAALVSSSNAAAIVGTVTSATGDYNLTARGTSDWAYWSTTVASGFSGAPNQSKSGATLISNVSAIGGTLRGSTSANVANTFSWTADGTPTATGSSGTVRGTFSTNLDTVNAGVRLSITIPTTDTYVINIWTATFAGTGTLTASFDGGSTLLYTSPGETAGVGNPKQSYLFSLTVTADAPGSVLTIDNVLSTEDGATGSSHVIISGAAIGIIPEPSTAALLGVVGSLALLKRKRWARS